MNDKSINIGQKVFYHIIETREISGDRERVDVKI